MYDRGIKRIIDLILSVIIFLILLPVFIIIIFAIKIDSKGPVFFKQKRVGKGKSYFEILKFRTMYIDTPKDMPTHLLENPEAFITKVGKFLRKTSLDELPQLFNVLIGEMSIIGPRASEWNSLNDYLPEELDKMKVKPGITGYTQAYYRNSLSLRDKRKYDVWYANNMGFLLDTKIFF